MSEWMRTEHKSGSEFDPYQLSPTHWMLRSYTFIQPTQTAAITKTWHLTHCVIQPFLFITDNILEKSVGAEYGAKLKPSIISNLNNSVIVQIRLPLKHLRSSSHQ